MLTFFDVADGKSASLCAVLVPNWDVLLPAIAAEVNVVEVAAAVAGDELLTIQGDSASAWRFQGGEDFTPA